MTNSFYWQIIENAWFNQRIANKARLEALRSLNKKSLRSLERYFNKVSESLEKELIRLSRAELSSFNHFIEEKLYHIDRKDIHRYTDGGDDSFYYSRGFIVGLGKYYYEQVIQHPQCAVLEAEFYEMCFIGYKVFEERFGEEFERYQYHNAETGSNPKGWE